MPEAWMVRANSTCRVDRLPSGFSERLCESRRRLFNGVRSSCDMLARNSDLYLDVSASCLAFSSSARLACSTSPFLCSTSVFCCSSRLLISVSSSVSACDCCRSSSVRMLAAMVLSTTPMLSVSCFKKSRCTSLKRRKEASSMTALTPPSKSTGSTTMLGAAASPSAEPTRT